MPMKHHLPLSKYYCDKSVDRQPFCNGKTGCCSEPETGTPAPTPALNENCTYDLKSNPSKCGLVEELPIEGPPSLDAVSVCTSEFGKPEDILVNITGTILNIANSTNATCLWLNESDSTFLDESNPPNDSSNITCDDDTLTVVQGNVSHLLFSAYLL